MAKAINTLADAYRRHAIDLLRFDAGLRRKALALLRKLEQDLVRQLSVSGLSGEGGGLTAFERTRLTHLLGQVQATVDAAYDDMARTMGGQLMPLAEIENRFLTKSFATSLSTTMLTDALTVGQLATIMDDTMIRGAPSKDWWDRQKASLRNSFMDQMRQGLVAGETNQDLIRRVRGRRENGFKDGIMATTRREAEALVRSSVQAVANETRTKFYRENSDVVQGYIYHATLDNRTTQQCAALDGYMWDLDGNPKPGQGKEVSFQQPPIHWNCRSTLLPLLVPFKDLGVDVDLPPATRASMDGPQVPADDTFEDWLRGKPAAFQDDLLGPGKAELFRKGKIDLIDMIDQTGRPLSLAEVEARI